MLAEWGLEQHSNTYNGQPVGLTMQPVGACAKVGVQGAWLGRPKGHCKPGSLACHALERDSRGTPWLHSSCLSASRSWDWTEPGQLQDPS